MNIYISNQRQLENIGEYHHSVRGGCKYPSVSILLGFAPAAYIGVRSLNWMSYPCVLVIETTLYLS